MEVNYFCDDLGFGFIFKTYGLVKKTEQFITSLHVEVNYFRDDLGLGFIFKTHGLVKKTEQFITSLHVEVNISVMTRLRLYFLNAWPG